MSVGYQIEI